MRSSSASKEFPVLDVPLASRFARIALGHVRREYPNRLDHVLHGPADLKSPRALHPVFYGSFDWHSCVHSYWLLATLYRLHPGLSEAAAIRTLFNNAFIKENIAGECAYLKRKSGSLFERPYGWAWLLMLQAELLRHETRQGRTWASALRPLSATFAAWFASHLPEAIYPNRAGTHGNSAFALTLALEYAQMQPGKVLAQLICKAARRWYAKDADCQAWEPSGEDFLSPALMEAVCMGLVLSPRAYEVWLGRFLPRLEMAKPATLFSPARVSDRTDGRIVHLDGLNLSRAWCWRAIAEDFPVSNPLCRVALRAAQKHFAASFGFLSGHYMGEHWLASFALLALRGRLRSKRTIGAAARFALTP
jgi:hypothetical protein